MNILFYSKQIGAHGVSIIISHFIDACKRFGVGCNHIDSLLDQYSKDDLIMAYGVKEAVELLKDIPKADIAFLTDAISLGYKNKVLFYLKHLNVFQYDFFYSIYAFLKYRRQERIACRSYEKIILVSPADVEYLIRVTHQPREKFFYVANGVDVPKENILKSNSKIFRLGLLASWGAKQTFSESAWFVKDYFVKYYKKHPDVILKLVGRGPYIYKLGKIPGVEVLGEVESLNETFKNIDVFIGANPKGCGVLNRCLDAMSLRTPILSLPQCFTGIPNSDDLYYKYTDYDSFEKQLDYLRNNMDDTKERTDKAFDYVQENNNWDINYDRLLKEIGLVTIS